MREGVIIAGKYRLERSIGEGAMGVVWSAVNETTERHVAIKLISHVLAGNEEGRMRLIREARACGRISHRNVVEIYDAGETDDGDPFLVMPLLVGETLASRIQREQRLAPFVAANFGCEIARGLAAAHAAGIVHRDLKPGNIFLVHEADTGEDGIKLLDFGVSKILAAQDAVATATGSALGSPAYMSPEQARGDRNIDHRTDLWAFGVVLFEMLTGTRPFIGDSPYTVVADILGGRIPDVRESLPSVDPGLAALIASCLERDVQRRVASAGDIVQNLRGFLGSARTDMSGPLLADASGPLPAPTHILPPTSHGRLPPSVTSTTPVLGNAFARPQRTTFPLALVGGIAITVVFGLGVVGTAFFTLRRPTSDATSSATHATVAPSVTAAAVEATPTVTTTSAPPIAQPPTTTTSSRAPRSVETHPQVAPPAKSATPTKTKTRLPTDPG